MKKIKDHPESAHSPAPSGSTLVALASGISSGESAAVTLDQAGPWQLTVVGRWNTNSNIDDVAMALEQSPDGGTTWVPVVYELNGAQTRVTVQSHNLLTVPPLLPIDLPSPCSVRVVLSGATDATTSLSVYMQPLSSWSG